MQNKGRIYKHLFQTFLFNGNSFRNYWVIGDSNRYTSRKRLDLLIETSRLRILKKDYTEFREFEMINSTF